MEGVKEMQIQNNWLRLLVYFLFWIFCSVLLYMPVLIFSPNLPSGLGTDLSLLRSNLVYLGATQIAAVLSVFFSTYLMVSKIENRRFTDIKLTLDITNLLKGFLLSTLIILTFCLIMQIIGAAYFSYSAISPKIIFSFFLFSIVAIGEEIMVRGYILNNLREKLSDYHAIFISSLIFGCMHLFNDSFTLIGFFNITLSGFLLGTLFIKSNTLSAPIGLHWAWNFIQGPIAGFNVSGHKEAGILTVEKLAPDFITGGDFGAEGSILLTPIICIAIYVVWKYYRPSTISLSNQKL
ncbi:MAG: CPBP family intramembrane metalloprotease [Cyclobacteriaceae bacterium]|nr:CPBP family intramembrane metalloprotease [Cyclobacteriaceae bacterium]